MICFLTTHVIPVEFFNKDILDSFTNDFLKKEPFHEEKENIFPYALKHKCDSIYSLVDKNTRIIILKTKTSLVFSITKLKIFINYQQAIYYSVQEKYDYAHCFFDQLSDSLKNLWCSLASMIEDPFNYSFTFFSIKDGNYDGVDFPLEIKILAQPSLLDISELKNGIMSFQLGQDSDLFSKVKKSCKSIKNIDISKSFHAFVTWSSLVFFSKESTEKFYNNHLLFLYLEMYLQDAWNKNYLYCKKIDSLFDDGKLYRQLNRRKYFNLMDCLIDSYHILMDSKQMIHSRFSNRVDILFQEILKTSKIDIQVQQLHEKTNCLMNFMEKSNLRNHVISRKMYEIIIFVIAIPQLLQLFVKFPIDDFSLNTIITLGVFAIIFVLGLCLIIRKDYI